jgi:hypothetical protein
MVIPLELNGYGRIARDKKTPRLFYITNDHDPGLYANLFLFDRLGAYEGNFALSMEQKSLDLGFLGVKDPDFPDTRYIHMSHVTTMYSKPGFVDQIEGEWAWNWFKHTFRKLLRRGVRNAPATDWT